MPAPKGNSFWKNVEHPGRPRKYTPDQLWEKALEFFKHYEANPFYEAKPFGTGYEASVAKPRPFTETAFRIFANLPESTWLDYCSGKDAYQDFSGVTKRIKEIIYAQKFEGASAGFFNPVIIARDLGLKDQSETRVRAEVSYSEMTEDEIRERLEKYKTRP